MAGINLLDMILKANNGGAVQQAAAKTGLAPDLAQMAIKALLPAISGGLQRNVQKPGGLESLLGALNKGNHSQYLDQPETLGQQSAITEGNGILGHLLGSKDLSRAVASQAAQKTGLGADVLQKMLPMVAAMAMGSLSKQSQQPDMLSALAGALGGQQQAAPAQGGLGGLLGAVLGGGQQQRAAPQSGALGLLGGLLDADGDGNPMDDIFQMVMKR